MQTPRRRGPDPTAPRCNRPRARRVAFIVYDGNMKGPKEPCREQRITSRATSCWNRRAPRPVFIPGQHDWADCASAEAGGFDPGRMAPTSCANASRRCHLDGPNTCFRTDARERGIALSPVSRENCALAGGRHGVRRAQCAESEQSLSDRRRAQRRIRRPRDRQRILARTCRQFAKRRDVRARSSCSFRATRTPSAMNGQSVSRGCASHAIRAATASSSSSAAS